MRAAQLAHGVVRASQPLIRDAQVVMRERIFVIAAYRRLVIANRLIHLARFQMKISDVDERGREVRRDLECLFERRASFVDALQFAKRNAALVCCRDALCRRHVLVSQHCVQPRNGLLVPVVRDVAKRQIERRMEIGTKKSEELAEVEHWRLCSRSTCSRFFPRFSRRSSGCRLSAARWKRASSTFAITTCSTPYKETNEPTTCRSAAARGWSCASNRWHGFWTSSSLRRPLKNDGSSPSRRLPASRSRKRMPGGSQGRWTG